MTSAKTLFLCTMLGVAPIIPAQAQETSADTVVATVGGQDVTVGHMVAMLRTLPEEQQQLPDNVLFEGIMDRLIQQLAVSQSAPELSEGTRLQIENERNALIASNVVNGIAAEIEITDEAIKGAYDQRYSDIASVREYNASHILVPTEDEAKAIVTELEGGADFAELAKAKSTGPSGPGGGNLGWFGPGRMVPEFEAAVIALEIGQISAPVQTQFGWHVIKLNDSRIPEAPTLESMRAELATQVWQDALRARIAEMVDAAGVDRKDVSGIDPGVLRDPELVDF